MIKQVLTKWRDDYLKLESSNQFLLAVLAFIVLCFIVPLFGLLLQWIWSGIGTIGLMLAAWVAGIFTHMHKDTIKQRMGLS